MNNTPTQKRITVRMLEARMNALPILLDYIKRKAKYDPSASRTLALWDKEKENERALVLDQSEAVFGFAALLTTLDKEIKVGATHDASQIATLADMFCKVNELAPPAPGYHHRLRMPKVNNE